MKHHPLAQIIPSHSPEDFDRLVESMKKSGFDPHRPVVIHEGMILDGRHRYDAAKKAGVEVVAEDWQPAFEGDTPALFVLRSTYHRTLTTAQRAALAVEILPHIEQESMRRMKAGKATPEEKVPQGRRPQSREVAAKEAGTNEKYVEVASKVKKESPETFDKMKRGEVTVTEAKKAIERKPPQRKPEPANNLPPEVQAALEGADEFKEIVNKIRAIKKRALALSQEPHGTELAERWKRVEGALDTAAETVKFAAPHSLCPFHPNCETGTCKACRGRKWISVLTADAMPKK